MAPEPVSTSPSLCSSSDRDPSPEAQATPCSQPQPAGATASLWVPQGLSLVSRIKQQACLSMLSTEAGIAVQLQN